MEPREDSEQGAIAALLRDRFAAHNQLQPQMSLLDAVRRALPDDGIVVQGMNQLGYYSRNYLPVYEDGRFLSAVPPRHARARVPGGAGRKDRSA